MRQKNIGKKKLSISFDGFDFLITKTYLLVFNFSHSDDSLTTSRNQEKGIQWFCDDSY